MKLNIKVTDENYFSVLLSLLSSIKPFSELRPKELLVFAEILRFNNLYKDIPRADRMPVIFSYDIRLKIATRLNIQREGLYNLMKGLRDKGFITHNDIPEVYDRALRINNELIFKLDFEANEQ
jgi:hypothetical protein